MSYDRHIEHDAHQKPRVLPTRRLSIMLILWFGSVLMGLGYLISYSSAPGSIGRSQQNWPAGSRLERDSRRPTLILFIHPRCPCTQSSLEELARLLAGTQHLATVHAVFVKPEGVGAGWEHAENWERASALPEVTLFVDEGGIEARRFGAATSGHVQLYDAHGNLMFSGGITAARGHAGDNAGAAAVRKLLRGQPCDRRQTFVFGCPLRGFARAAQRGLPCPR